MNIMKQWNVPEYCNAAKVSLEGEVGEIEKRSLNRLQNNEFNYDFLVADLDFNQERWFTNFSGDVSGRFIEVMALASKGAKYVHPALSKMLDIIPVLQTQAGHFGVEIDWSQPIDNIFFGDAKMMPALWGSSRIFTGLIECYLAFGDSKLLDAAERLGNFYIATDERFCDPLRLDEYRETGSYAGGYVTCYFPGMEGLARLYQVTGKRKYLHQAEKMAVFRHEYRFDKLPIEHAHGYLCSDFSLLLLFAETGKQKYLTQVEEHWNFMVANGYVDPCGGVLEKAEIGFGRDEGCGEADWLRLNLELWRQTGKGRYLDAASRQLLNHFAVNQCKTGGFGHRFVKNDCLGQIGYGKYHEEALWCCTFHGAMAVQALKRYLAVVKDGTVFVNLPIDFSAIVKIGSNDVLVKQFTVAEHSGELLRQRIEIGINSGNTENVFLAIHKPDWADSLFIYDSKGNVMELVCHGDYLRSESQIVPGEWIEVVYSGGIVLENRFLERIDLESINGRINNVVLRYGVHVLTLPNRDEVPLLIMAKDINGKNIEIDDEFNVPVLSRCDTEGKNIDHLERLAEILPLTPQGAMSDEIESVFVFDVIFKC